MSELLIKSGYFCYKSRRYPFFWTHYGTVWQRAS